MSRLAVVAFFLCVSGLPWGSGFATGQEAAPAIVIEPANLEFGDQVAKEASRPVRITITNSGQANLYVNSVVLGGENPGDFALAGDACTGATIPPGKSCVLDVVMTPATTGPRRATATVNSNAVGGPQAIPLTGNGINSAAVPPR